MTKATATEVKNQFGKYLKLVQEGEEVVIENNGVEVARLVPRDYDKVNELCGILKDDGSDYRAEKKIALKKKYA